MDTEEQAMDMITAILEAVAARAPTADRNQLATLHDQSAAANEAIRAAAEMGVADEATLAAARNARTAAIAAVMERGHAIADAHAALIRDVRFDRRSRSTLRAMPTPGHVEAWIEAMGKGVDRLARDRGTELRLLIDGVDRGEVEAHAVGAFHGAPRGMLAIRVRDGSPDGRLETRPNAGIAAIAVEDDHFAVLMEDGALLEILEAA